MPTIYGNSHGRVPIIALDYSQRHLRRLKELMIDYKNGNLYIVDDTDINTIYDLTKQIIHNITTSITSDDIIVNIDGVGEINLTKFLQNIQNSMLFLNNDSIVDLIPENSKFDNKSLEIKDYNAQIKMFDLAQEGQIPVKEDGEIKWKSAGTSFNDAVVVDMKTDAGAEKVDVTLNSDTLYSTRNPPPVFQVTFANDKLDINKLHAKITWIIECGLTVPVLLMPSNVFWEFNTDPTLFVNCTGVYTFETFDGGRRWLAKVDKYLINPEAEVTESYIKDKLSWKIINSKEFQENEYQGPEGSNNESSDSTDSDENP